MSENPSDIVRRTVYFSGTVQGVNFRYTTRAVASRYKVTGYVRNLRDGRVELVAEGTGEELDQFQRAIADAMCGYIKDTETADTNATDEFASFTIVM
ncbi:MAG: acylphosphatase [Planctomycetota bacterium]|jgi:acylphosphatase